MRRVILVTLTLTSAAWNAVLDDLPLTEIPRNGENLKGPGFPDFNSVGRCWNEYCWIIFDPLIHYQSLLLYLQILFATAEACALPIATEMIYLFVSICGYLYTGCYTCGNVLLNFSQDDACPPDLIQQNLMKHWKRRRPI